MNKPWERGEKGMQRTHIWTITLGGNQQIPDAIPARPHAQPHWILPMLEGWVVLEKRWEIIRRRKNRHRQQADTLSNHFPDQCQHQRSNQETVTTRELAQRALPSSSTA